MFANRIDAGQQLATKLLHLADEHPVVLGLPRGGVPVAAEVARALHAPFDIIVVRKLGIPFEPEVAMGAIGEDGAYLLDQRLIQGTAVTDEDIAFVEAQERALLEARVSRLRAIRPRIDLQGRTAVIVDDGIATGSTAAVACDIARTLGAKKVVLAVPVAPPDVLSRFHADEVIAVHTPASFHAVGLHYRDFSPTSDAEVEELLAESTTGGKE